MMKMTTEHFADMGLITPEQEKEVNALIDESKGITLEKLLLERKFVTEEVIAETYSKVHGCCYCDVSAADIPENVVKKYNREKALKYHAIPIKFHGKYPVRKSIQTNFARVGGPDGLLFQADGVAYAEK